MFNVFSYLLAIVRLQFVLLVAGTFVIYSRILIVCSSDRMISATELIVSSLLLIAKRPLDYRVVEALEI